MDKKRYIQDIKINKGLVEGSVLVSKEGEAYVYFRNPVRDNDTVTQEALNNLKKNIKTII